MSVQQYEDVWASEEPEAPSENTPLPVGSYDATVRGVKLKSWDDGSRSVEWEFQVVGGAHDGRVTWMNAGLDKAKIAKTKGHFALLGIMRPTLSETIAAFPSIEGRGVKISVTEWNGKLYRHLNALADNVTVARPAPAPAPAPAVTATLPGIPADAIPFA